MRERRQLRQVSRPPRRTDIANFLTRARRDIYLVRTTRRIGRSAASRKVAHATRCGQPRFGLRRVPAGRFVSSHRRRQQLSRRRPQMFGRGRLAPAVGRVCARRCAALCPSAWWGRRIIWVVLVPLLLMRVFRVRPTILDALSGRTLNLYGKATARPRGTPRTGVPEFSPSVPCSRRCSRRGRAGHDGQVWGRASRSM